MQSKNVSSQIQVENLTFKNKKLASEHKKLIISNLNLYGVVNNFKQ